MFGKWKQKAIQSEKTIEHLRHEIYRLKIRDEACMPVIELFDDVSDLALIRTATKEFAAQMKVLNRAVKVARNGNLNVMDYENQLFQVCTNTARLFTNVAKNWTDTESQDTQDGEDEEHLKVLQFDPARKKSMEQMLRDIEEFANSNTITAAGFTALTTSGACHSYDFYNNGKAMGLLGCISALKYAVMNGLCTESEDDRS